ncbi:hypothetical protein VdG1_04314 [Verticillium dahliae VDG1]|nr:hypothetical protein VdG1_04314 [Verticillium dahliae VDG1]
MAPPKKVKGKKPQPLKREIVQEKRKQQQLSIAALEKSIAEFDPKATEVTTFAELPLCEPTKQGLEKSHFTTLTDIQSRAVPLALQGQDILGAAKTGSGKTLAFLLPKLDTLYGFIKANLKSKMIVFFSSGKQVDCPEDADTYIHRVGRTARYEREGRAVLFMDPSEEAGMLERLKHKKVPINKITVKESKKKSVTKQLQSMCFQYPELKYLGQKAFISYTRSVYLQKDKHVFKFDSLDLDAYAASLGLPGTPQIKFQKGEDIKKVKNAPRAGLSSDEDDDDSDLDGLDGELDPEKAKLKKKSKKNEVKTKYDRMFERTNQDVLSGHYSKVLGEADDDDADDFLAVKRVIDTNDLDDPAQAETGPKKVTIGSQETDDEEAPADGRKVLEIDREPETLEDLEALAAGLLE